MNTPNTENIKNTSNSNPPTFTKEGSDNIRVYSNFCISSKLFINLNTLETRSTLNTLANYGPTLIKLRKLAPIISISRSIIEVSTTKKSNLFHPLNQ